MAWQLANQVIHVDSDSDDQAEPILGQIQVLDASTTILHFAGSKSYTRTIKFWCETDARWAALLAAAIADSDVTLVSDLGSQGSYRILKITGERKHAVNQPNAWFYGTAELMKR